jgi:hypothetical protein
MMYAAAPDVSSCHAVRHRRARANDGADQHVSEQQSDCDCCAGERHLARPFCRILFDRAESRFRRLAKLTTDKNAFFG